MRKATTRRKQKTQDRAKQRAREQAKRQARRSNARGTNNDRHGGAGRHAHSLWELQVDSVLRAAVLSAVAPDGRRRPPEAVYVQHLAERPEETAGALATELLAAVERAWSRHWQPADVVRAVERNRSDRHARLVEHSIVAQLRTYSSADLPPRWQAQIDAMDPGPAARNAEATAMPTLDLGDTATDDAADGDPSWALPGHLTGDRLTRHLVAAIEALAYLQVLPRLPKIGPLPGEPAGRQRPVEWSQVDSAVLQRVTALLAKAESTTFAEEAEALTTKAQQLMARHAIDMALVEATRRQRDGEAAQVASARRVGVDDPYASPKAMLLQEIAEANRCRSVWSKDFGFSTVFGDEVDLDTTELLYTSLLVQSARAMLGTSPAGKADAAKTRAFRQSFLVSFATRVGERLREAVADAVRATDVADSDLLPVLADREAAADRACDDAFPSVRSASTTANSSEGWHAGRSAADRAHLDLSDRIGSGHDTPSALP